jgi:hypothetical protein
LSANEILVLTCVDTLPDVPSDMLRESNDDDNVYNESNGYVVLESAK